nr:copia protein [Tanacetum cinerariifolium]
MAAGSRDRPQMLAAGRYPQWRSRFLRSTIEVTDDSLTVPEHMTVETPMKMSLEIKAHFLAEKEAIHLILTGIGDEIYSTVDACQTTQEMWEAIERLQQERLDRNANPLALVATAQADRDPYYQTSRSHRSSAPSPKPSIPSRSHTSTRHKGKEIAKPITPLSEIASEEDREDVAEQGVSLQAEQYDWLADTDEEVDEQELEAHYSYMAKIQEVPTADSGTDSERVEQVPNDAGYNLFANGLQHSKQSKSVSNTCLVETDDSNVIPNSPDMCEDDIQNDQNDVESDDERVALANLIANLNSMGSISVRDSCLVALQTKQIEFEKYKAFNDRTVDYDKLEHLKAKLQDKNIAISELKKLTEKGKGKYVDTKFDRPSVVRQPNAQRIPKPSVLGKPAPFSNSLDRIYFPKTKSVLKTNVSEGLSKPVTAQTLPQTARQAVSNTNVLKPEIPQLKSNQSRDKVLPNNSQVKAKKTQVEVHPRIPSVSNKMKSITACKDSLNSKTLNANAVCATCNKCLVDSNHFACVTKILNDVHAITNKPTVVPISTRKPKSQANKLVATPHNKKIVQLILFIVDSGYTKHMTGNLKLLCNFVEKFLGTVHFGNDQFAPILGYRDLVQGNVTINRVYYVEGLNHNLFSVGQFCDADLEVAFKKSTCFVRDLQGNDLLIGNRGSDLYTISLQESTSSTPLYLMSKATPTQAWLWHRRLSHLNFDYINLLSKKDIMIGLPKLKYVKDQLCSSCELSKAKRSSFKSKAVSSSKGRLNLLHMDLCGPMRVASINGKKYILVIVYDYSRYTWTLFLPDTDVPSQQELDLLFGPLYNEFFNAGSNPLMNIPSTSAPSTHTNVHAEENNNDQAEEREQLQDDKFTNPFCALTQDVAESSSHNIDLSGNPVDQTDYHSKIGSLMYLTSSRPDIVQAVCFCTRYQSRPTEKHKKRLKRFWYLKGFSFELIAFLDADHAGCIDSRKSTSGGIQFLGDKLVSWMSKKQNCTAMSLAEAEYVALSASCAQVMWMRTQLQDYGFNYNNIPLYCDSQSAIAISCNPVQHSRTKHIHTRYHFIKEQVENGIIELYFVRTKYQLADMFIKALPEDWFKYLVRRIGMRCLTTAELDVLAKESA